MINYDALPQTLKDFLFYLETVLGKSKSTTYEYILDLENFFRYMKIMKNSLPKDVKLHDVAIHDIDVAFVSTITVKDIYEYLYYCREKRRNGSRTIARKMSTLRTYFKFMTQKQHLLSSNPMENVETPSLPKTLPKYLSLEESTELLRVVNSRRDYAILTLFLNCGMRLAELVSLNTKDIKNEYVVITGKGNKQRTIHLNQACRTAVDDYITHERPTEGLKDPDALFISRNKARISRRAVQNLVEKYLKLAGLDSKNLSTHKLRHTAATLMHRYGHVDIRVLQEILGHENLGTTQIYTHVDSEAIKEASMSNPLSNVKRKKTDG